MKHPASIQPLPLDTADAARSIFNIENVYLSIGDQIDQLFSDLNLSELDSSGGKQADSLCMLAMVTIFQYAEKMPDRQAAEALRRRTDWKYALHLSLVTPGFDPDSLLQHLINELISAGRINWQKYRALIERGDVWIHPTNSVVREYVAGHYGHAARILFSRVRHLRRCR